MHDCVYNAIHYEFVYVFLFQLLSDVVRCAVSRVVVSFLPMPLLLFFPLGCVRSAHAHTQSAMQNEKRRTVERAKYPKTCKRRRRNTHDTALPKHQNENAAGVLLCVQFVEKKTLKKKWSIRNQAIIILLEANMYEGRGERKTNDLSNSPLKL